MNVQQRPICSWKPQESSLFFPRGRGQGHAAGSPAALPASWGERGGDSCREIGAPAFQFVETRKAGVPRIVAVLRQGQGRHWKPVSLFLSVSQALC